MATCTYRKLTAVSVRSRQPSLRAMIMVTSNGRPLAGVVVLGAEEPSSQVTERQGYRDTGDGGVAADGIRSVYDPCRVALCPKRAMKGRKGGPSEPGLFFFASPSGQLLGWVPACPPSSHAPAAMDGAALACSSWKTPHDIHHLSHQGNRIGCAGVGGGQSVGTSHNNTPGARRRYPVFPSIHPNGIPSQQPIPSHRDRDWRARGPGCSTCNNPAFARAGNRNDHASRTSLALFVRLSTEAVVVWSKLANSSKVRARSCRPGGYFPSLPFQTRPHWNGIFPPRTHPHQQTNHVRRVIAAKHRPSLSLLR